MSDLRWQKTADGYTCDDYHIRRLSEVSSPAARWRLEVVERRAPLHDSVRLSSSVHPSLRAAKERARRDERQRIQRARMSGHLIIGTMALLALVVVATLMENLVAFFTVAVLMYVGLGSLADAYWIWMNDAWGATRDEGPKPLTWSDRLVLAVIAGRRRRPVAAAHPEAAPAILLLPPEPA